jgi:LysR family transcriptional regulator, positive regulator for ilvC
LELRDLESFERLAALLHFARAAKSLGMSPSALTRRVQAIEETLGQKLIVRGPRSLELTEAGERFQRFASDELRRWAEFSASLGNDAGELTGKLRIACTVTACYSLLPRLLARCREQHPQLQVSLVTQDAERSLEELARGEVDVAVVPTDPSSPTDFSQVPLGTTDLCFIAPRPPGGPIPSELEPAYRTVPSLAQVPLIAPLGGIERQRLLNWFRERSLEPRIVAEVRGNEGILAMVSMGSGVALVPRLVLESSPLQSQVVSLPQLDPPRGYDVSLCARQRDRNVPRVRAFFQLAEGAAELGLDPESDGPAHSAR